MSRALSARRNESTTAHPRAVWPTPAQLASLGTVLCLYRADGSELAGWRQAVSVHACQGVDSEGVRESLCFVDARGRCVWRLYLLPDSDFLAWDRVVATLPPGPEHAADGSIGERLWRRLVGHLGGQRWRLCALRACMPPMAATRWLPACPRCPRWAQPPRSESPAWKVPTANYRWTIAAAPAPHACLRPGHRATCRWYASEPPHGWTTCHGTAH
ncbi:MAG: hypothetical protein GAK31_02970 [Stenotrophomonas maltophilia]|uniref:Hemin transport protein n=1 Tax=Stenotrophomonas maltophilia TaxID=40324 RepID=A0A7V8JKV5_STEMA|nr:MAG: hypothetical protein GAK31_02970 [Stenotrophomonas maltophilia]